VALAGDALRIAAPAILMHAMGTLRHGSGPRARGLTFLSLASHQLAHALRLAPTQPRSDILDRPIELGVAASYMMLAAPFALAPLRRVLRVATPRPLEAALIIGFSLAPFAVQLLRSRTKG
jgi:Ca2+-transporting ATPase